MRRWGLRIGIIAVVAGLRLWQRQDWVGNLLLAAGWGIGYLLAEADHLFYVAVCNPQELTCQRIRHEILETRNWRNAWGILQSTKGERTRLPVRNVLTGMIVAGLGLWAVFSGVNLLGVGVVMGLTVKLLTELAVDANWTNWYWLFARQFSEKEHRIVMAVWGIVTVWGIWRLVRI